MVIIFRFHESMKRMTLSSPLRELTTPTMTSSMASLSLSSSSSSLSPPHTLLDFPPIAQLTNALIHAFNELRQCAPLSLAPSIAQEIKRLLESTVHDIGEYYRYMYIHVCYTTDLKIFMLSNLIIMTIFCVKNISKECQFQQKRKINMLGLVSYLCTYLPSSIIFHTE